MPPRWRWLLRNLLQVFDYDRTMRRYVRQPSFGAQLRTSLRPVGTFDDFYRPFAQISDLRHRAVSGLRHRRHRRRCGAGWGIARADNPQQRTHRAPSRFLNAGFMHLHELDKDALRVGNDMTLAILDLLCCILTPLGPPLSVVFTDLAVDHPSRRARFSALPSRCVAMTRVPLT